MALTTESLPMSLGALRASKHWENCSANRTVKDEMRENLIAKLKSGGELFPDYGEVVWNLHLNPGETKKITLVYTIKYPKTQRVTFGLQSEQTRGNNSNRAMKKR